MRKTLLVLVGLLLVAATGYSALLSEDFESETVGNEPSGTIGFVSDANGDASATVIDSTANKAGSGQGLQLVDQGTIDYFRLGYEFSATGETAVRIDVDVARLTAGTTGTDFYVGLFDTDGLSGSFRDRYAEFKLDDQGNLGNSAGGTKTAELALNTSYTLTMYANDGDTAIIDYEGTRDLAADSVDFWLDGTYWGGGSLRDSDGTDPSNTTSALAAIGFISLSSTDGIDYAVDNISVTAIPEPATLSTLGLVLFAFIYRKLRRK